MSKLERMQKPIIYRQRKYYIKVWNNCSGNLRGYGLFSVNGKEQNDKTEKR